MKIEEDYKKTMEAVELLKLENEKGLLCDQFAKRHNLVFLGFSVADGSAMFHDPAATEPVTNEPTPSATAPSALDELTVAELKALCDSAEITYTSRTSKGELIELLSAE